MSSTLAHHDLSDPDTLCFTWIHISLSWISNKIVIGVVFAFVIHVESQSLQGSKLSNPLSSTQEMTSGKKSPPFIQGFGGGNKFIPQEKHAAFQTDIKELPLSQGRAKHSCSLFNTTTTLIWCEIMKRKNMEHLGVFTPESSFSDFSAYYRL